MNPGSAGYGGRARKCRQWTANFESYLENLPAEIAELNLTADESSAIRSPLILGKLLSPGDRPGFIYHFAPLLEQAAQFLCLGRPRPRIVELGCGIGLGSILFGLLGAQVTGLDVDPILVGVARKRQQAWSRRRQLAVDFIVADCMQFDYRTLAPISGVYSLFAFNLMPGRQVLERLAPCLDVETRIVISDGNREAAFNRLFRPRATLSVPDLTTEIRRLGPGIRTSTTFHCPLPAPILRILGRPFGRALEAGINSIQLGRWAGVSYTLLVECRARATPEVSHIPHYASNAQGRAAPLEHTSAARRGAR